MFQKLITGQNTTNNHQIGGLGYEEIFKRFVGSIY